MNGNPCRSCGADHQSSREALECSARIARKCGCGVCLDCRYATLLTKKEEGEEVNDSTRISVSDASITKAVRRVIDMMGKRLGKHGPMSYASAHETYGIVAEEMDELLEAIRLKEPERTARVLSELEDVAVAAVFGIASILERLHNAK